MKPSMGRSDVARKQNANFLVSIHGRAFFISGQIEQAVADGGILQEKDGIFYDRRGNVDIF